MFFRDQETEEFISNEVERRVKEWVAQAYGTNFSQLLDSVLKKTIELEKVVRQLKTDRSTYEGNLRKAFLNDLQYWIDKQRLEIP